MRCGLLYGIACREAFTRLISASQAKMLDGTSHSGKIVNTFARLTDTSPV
jgi:hypothetical protein